MVATGSTLEEANRQKAALNMAKFIKGTPQNSEKNVR